MNDLSPEELERRKTRNIKTFKWLGIPLVLLVLFVIVASLFEDGDGDRPATTAITSESRQTTTQKRPEKSSKTDFEKDEATLRRYLSDNFSATTWYRSIKSVTVGTGVFKEDVTVATDLSNNPRNREDARNICRAITLGKGDLRSPIDRVKIEDNERNGLVSCRVENGTISFD